MEFDPAPDPSGKAQAVKLWHWRVHSSIGRILNMAAAKPKGNPFTPRIIGMVLDGLFKLEQLTPLVCFPYQ